jgi:hypothetical protein
MIPKLVIMLFQPYILSKDLVIYINNIKCDWSKKPRLEEGVVLLYFDPPPDLLDILG